MTAQKPNKKKPQKKNQKNRTAQDIDWSDPELVRGITNYVSHIKSNLKAAPEVEQSRDSGVQQLVQAFLLLALIIVVAWFGLMVYFNEPLPPEMMHIERGK